MENGTAQLLASPKTKTKSGDRGTSELLKAFTFPTEFERARPAPALADGPKAMHAVVEENTRHLGAVLDVEPTASRDGRSIYFSGNIRRSQLDGFDQFECGVRSDGLKYFTKQPRFTENHTTTAAVIQVGVPFVAGAFCDQKKPGRVELHVLTATTHEIPGEHPQVEDVGWSCRVDLRRYRLSVAEAVKIRLAAQQAGAESPEILLLKAEGNGTARMIACHSLPTIPGAGFYLNTLLSLVRADFPQANPVHRLGRATSGLVLFALNSQIASTLNQGWAQVHKQYQALGSGVASQEAYDIRTPIGPQAHPRLGQVHAASPTGKPSRSIARTLQRRANTTVFEVDLLTGRPHQIRIHLACIGHPLEGDPLYADGGQPKIDQPGLPGDAGYWLHAKRLQFEHPSSGERLVLIAPLPEILHCE